ncbi:MAG: hypothetical protein WA919_18805 [Coleofasciculaceae cyanobacterium]
MSVQPVNNPGIYNVTGTTNLPDKSQIAIAAIRYLRTDDDTFIDTELDTNYSILDRKIVEIDQGKWQTNLILWQVSPDGRFREAWQLNQPLVGQSLNPTKQVTFIATFDPSAKLPSNSDEGISVSEEQEQQVQELQGDLVRFNQEGNPYVQASQSLRIGLPVGRKSPPALRTEDINGGWGNRYELPASQNVVGTLRPQPIETKQINTPLSPPQFLR